MPPPEWLQYGSFGVLVLALIWGARYAIPRALALHEVVVTKIAEQNKAASDQSAKDSKEAINKLTADHKETVTGLVAEFRAEMKDQRDFHERELAKRDTAIGKVATAIERIGEKALAASPPPP